MFVKFRNSLVQIRADLIIRVACAKTTAERYYIVVTCDQSDEVVDLNIGGDFADEDAARAEIDRITEDTTALLGLHAHTFGQLARPRPQST